MALKKEPVTCQRQEIDGGVGVTNNDDGTYTIQATHDKVFSSFRVTEWNARRLLGSLALMLGVKLPKNVKIEMGTVTAKYVPEKPLQTLGERVAWHMGMQAMAKKTGAEILEPPKSGSKKEGVLVCSKCGSDVRRGMIEGMGSEYEGWVCSKCNLGNTEKAAKKGKKS